MTTKFNKFYNSAMIAGLSLIIMMLLAFFAFGYAHSSLIIPGNAMGTLSNLINAKSLFLYEIIAWVFIIIADILVTYAFYIYLKDINTTQSLLAGILRLVYTVILTLAVANLFGAYQLIGINAELSSTLANDVNVLIQSFENIWSLGLIIFGAHLFMIGLISYHSAVIPRFIAVLLIIAGISYTAIHIMYGFVPQLDEVTKVVEMILSIPMTVGEIGFGIWLLIKGRKLKQVN